MLLGIQIGTLLWLMVGSLMDYVNKKIPKWYAIGSILFGLIVWALSMDGEWWAHVIGGMIGLVFFLFAKFTGEQIGYGDAYILTGIGLGIGGEQMMWMLTYCFAVLFFVSVFLLILKKVNRKSEVAFLPFVFTGYFIFFLVKGVG